jgi:hypothetical protein
LSAYDLFANAKKSSPVMQNVRSPVADIIIFLEIDDTTAVFD